MEEKYFTCHKCRRVYAAWVRAKKDEKGFIYYLSTCPFCQTEKVKLYERS